MSASIRTRNVFIALFDFWCPRAFEQETSSSRCLWRNLFPWLQGNNHFTSVFGAINTNQFGAGKISRFSKSIFIEKFSKSIKNIKITIQYNKNILSVEILSFRAVWEQRSKSRCLRGLRPERMKVITKPPASDVSKILTTIQNGSTGQRQHEKFIV